MDVDVHMLEWLVERRLAEARAFSARQALVRSVRDGRGGLLAAVGLALMRMGRRLARGRPGRWLAAQTAR